MKYMGAKTEGGIGRKLFGVMSIHYPKLNNRGLLSSTKDPAPRIWEPFCGGANMTVILAKLGLHVIATDYSLPVVSLYNAIVVGWLPPEPTKDGYVVAKLLPDEDPLKAYYGHALSFGGKWFGGYSRGNSRADDKYDLDFIKFVKALYKHRKHVSFAHRNFLTIKPKRLHNTIIYADPPYRGCTPYKATEPFDNDLFDLLCVRWAENGVPVFISEYASNVGEEVAAFNVIGFATNLVKKTSTEKLFLLR